MDVRTVERIMLAAANCEPVDDRQAALIGGIVQNLLHGGTFLPNETAKIAADRMGWSMTVATDIDRAFRAIPVEVTGRDGYWSGDPTPLAPRMYPQRGYPTMPEVRAAAELFRAQYDPPKQEVAA